MALTEETIKIDIKLSCEYKYNGAKLDQSDLENIERNVKDAVLDAIWNSTELVVQCEADDFEEVSENIYEFDIKN